MDALARDAPALCPPGRQRARALHHLPARVPLARPLPAWAAERGQRLASAGVLASAWLPAGLGEEGRAGGYWVVLLAELCHASPFYSS